ncbi:hypothetical protein [Leucobacter ruminantium]|uniref:Oxygen-dependent protoporphyrinogen oxidase n=1 Tax=Leucobacter ruminantium TaxID=1289170 RepID=A0A939RTX2_9MICO|nr:hypothetical protein [Leucobacter ruminantium]MBO1804965.1 hypothetical protein [Leucobacter ruminantium]
MTAERIASLDACVVGDSLPAFAAALELAEVGLRVRVLLPGAGVWPETGEPDPDHALTALLDRIAAPISGGGPAVPAALPTAEAPGRVLMADARGGWSPVPQPSVFGIPAVPASSESLAFLRGGAAVRAYLDRVKPLLTIGKTHELGRLVHLRMGEAVFDRLVAPLVRERFGVADVEVAVAAPGLNEALTLAGSLSGAVLAYSERHVARETRVAPAGGWPALRAALMDRLALYGVELFELDAAADLVDGITGTGFEVETGQGSWAVRHGDEACEAQALVVDTSVRLPVALAEALAVLRPTNRRARTVVPVTGTGAQVEAVAAASADAHAADAPADALADALSTVEASGGAWSVRLVREHDGGMVARLAGPAVTSEDAECATGAASAAGEARTVLEAAGLTALSPLRVEWRAAPYVSLAERDAARARLVGEREADPSLLAVGRELHGDDLAVAVADATASATALRRRLTGISD